MSFNLFSQSRILMHVIAEIGNNHQGSLESAIKLMMKLKNAELMLLSFRKDVIVNYLFQFYDSPYDNPNSFGKTYGLHRDNIELSIQEMAKLKEYSDK